MAENLRKIIQNQELFTTKDKLLVGISGGMDSMVLCTLLHEARFYFIIAHCNYNLRGNESVLDEELVMRWAKEHEIPFYSKSFKKIKKKNLQEEARNLRYQFFRELKREQNCRFIVTAHHADDQLETFFLNLSRGAGLHGLKGMEKFNNEIARPLLSVSKSEIKKFAEKYNVPYRKDLSNEESDYLRNFIRNEIIHDIKQRIPAFEKMMFRSIGLLQAADSYLQQEYAEWKNRNVSQYGPEIRITKPESKNIYLLTLFLAESGFHPETIFKIQNSITQAGKIFQDKNKHQLLIDREYIYLQQAPDETIAHNYILKGDQGQLQTDIGSFTWEQIEIHSSDVVFQNTENIALFDINRIAFPLVLRSWKPGDIIKPLGMSGKSKKVQDVFTDCKIPRFKKQDYYLLISGDEILWIPGILRSDTAKIDKSTKSYLRISFECVASFDDQ